MPTLSTHVLDTATGRPAAGLPVQLLDAAGRPVDRAVTDGDGRVAPLGPDLEGGIYTLRFDLSAYRPGAFYPEVAVTVSLDPHEDHYHVPLLLSAYGYTTYRGS